MPHVNKQETATQAFQTKESPRPGSRHDEEDAALEQVGHARAALAVAGRGSAGLLRHLRARMAPPGAPALCSSLHPDARVPHFFARGLDGGRRKSVWWGEGESTCAHVWGGELTTSARRASTDT